MENTIYLSGGVPRNEAVRFVEPVNFSLAHGEHLAVVGPNGAGKSVLVDVLTGRFPLRDGVLEYDFSPAPTNTVYENVRYIAFRDAYGAGESNFCYQLRWNAHDQDGDIPTVAQLLGECADAARRDEVLRLFGLVPLLDKKIIMLSSGELRKFRVAEALFSSPRLLIMDNPFIGLDAEARSLLVSLLETLSSEGALQIMLILSDEDALPSFITHVVPVRNMTVGKKMSREEYSTLYNNSRPADEPSERRLLSDIRSSVANLPAADDGFSGDEVLSFKNVNVAYGNRTILKNISWRVERGEVWALTGRNGSGKSTLLSLVCADNLQSYACDISLFGRRRGSGESIWDIKRHIGYVSPEMHRSYLRNLPMRDIVASGLHDSIGLYVRSTPEQFAACEFWMRIFGIEHLAERSFIRLSGGEQRLALLARAFVKDPRLLILDEPLHGLDGANRRRAKAVIEAFSQRVGKTVIYVSHYEEEFPSTVTHRLSLVRVG